MVDILICKGAHPRYDRHRVAKELNPGTPATTNLLEAIEEPQAMQLAYFTLARGGFTSYSRLCQPSPNATGRAVFSGFQLKGVPGREQIPPEGSTSPRVDICVTEEKGDAFKKLENG